MFVTSAAYKKDIAQALRQLIYRRMKDLTKEEVHITILTLIILMSSE